MAGDWRNIPSITLKMPRTNLLIAFLSTAIRLRHDYGEASASRYRETIALLAGSCIFR